MPDLALGNDPSGKHTPLAVDASGLIKLAAGTNNIGDVDIASALPAGTNNIGDVDIASALPAGTNNIGDVDVLTKPVAGSHANAWNAALTGAGGTSTAVDCQYVPHVTVFGNTSGASTLTIQYSQDNTNFYDSASTVAANGNFSLSVTAGARYVRVKSSADVTATVTVAGKS